MFNILKKNQFYYLQKKLINRNKLIDILMYSQTKIAIPIFQKNCKNVIEVANDCIKKGADVLEFRIDALENPKINEIKKTIEEINFPMIATNRIITEGGLFKGSEEERFNILYECCDLVDYVDIELQSNNEYINKIHETNTTTIVSYHDFEKTPKLSEINYIVEKEHELGDIAKVAFMPQNLEDTLTILAVLSHCEDTIAISMADLGSYTRVMASKFNSPITFAAGTDVTAPGQIDIETMKALLNMNLDIMD